MRDGSSSGIPECLPKTVAEESVYTQLSKGRAAELCPKGDVTFGRAKKAQVIRWVV